MRELGMREEDLTGKIALVTGANSGLGLETSRALAARGARVLMACRSAEKAREALEDVKKTARAEVEFVPLDLGDLASVRACAAVVKGRTPKLDLLINNAGVMGVPRTLTKDGFEMQLGTNHLGHYALTALLLDRCLEATAARIVCVSSIAHVAGRIDFADPNGERFYFRWTAYCQSKLANLLFAIELERRLRRAGARAIANACHPGIAATNLQFVAARMEGSPGAERFWALNNRLVSQSAADGAKPTLHAATSPDAVGGGYYGPNGFLETRGAPAPAFVAPQAKNEDVARDLFDLSASMTGIAFPLR
jgi:NAD(P)-dependent dehydrogenase (short-subunit alcohol dehydrogenase family)